MEKSKELLNLIRPHVRVKSVVGSIDNKIEVYQKMIASLTAKKEDLIKDHEVSREEAIDLIEEWISDLPAQIVADSNLRQLVKALEYLNK